MADTSITFDTRLDSSQFDKGLDGIEKSFEDMKHTLADVATASQDAFGEKQRKEVEKLTQQLSKQLEKLAIARDRVETLQQRYDKLTSGAETPKSLQLMLDKLQKNQHEVAKLEQEFEKLAQRQEQLAPQFELMDLDEFAKVFPEQAQELERVEKQMDAIDTKIREINSSSSELNSTIQQIRLDPSASEEAKVLAQQLSEATIKLEKIAGEASNTEGALVNAAQVASKSFMNVKGVLGAVLSKLLTISKMVATGFVSGIRRAGGAIGAMVRGVRSLGTETGRTSRQTSMFGRQLRRVLLMALVFTAIRNSIRRLQEYMGGLLRTNEEFNASMRAINVNMRTAFTPIFDAIMPAINTFIAAIARATAWLAQFIALLGGTTVAAAREATQALNEQAEATNAAGGAARRNERFLASFDKINQAAAETAGGGGAGSELAELFDTPIIEFDMSWFDEFMYNLRSLDPDLELFRNLGTRVSDSIANALDNINWGPIQARAAALGSIFGALFDGVLGNPAMWQAIGRTLAEGLNTAVTFMQNFINQLDFENIGNAIGEGFNTLFSTFNFNMLGETAADFVQGIFDLFNGVLATTDWSLLGEGLADIANAFTRPELWYSVGDAISNGIDSAVDIAYAFVTNFNFRGFGESVAGGLNRVIHNTDWGRLGRTLSNSILGVLRSVNGFIQNVDWFQLGASIREFIVNIDWAEIGRTLLEGFQSAFRGVRAFLEGLFGSEIVAIVGTAAAAIAGAIAVITAAKAAWTAVTTALAIAKGVLFAPITLIVGAIAAVTAGVVLLIRNWDTVKEVAQRVWDAIVGFVTGAWESITGVFSAVGSWFSERFSAARDGIESAWSGVTGFFGGIRDGINDRFADVQDFFGGKFTEAWENVSNAWDENESFFQNVRNVQEAIFETIDGWFGGKFSAARDAIQDAWSSVAEWFSGVWEGITNAFSNVTSWFGNIFRQAWEGITSAWSGVIGWFQNIWNGITGVFSGAWEWFTNLGRSIVEGIWNGISQLASWLWDSVSGFFSGLWNNVRSFFRISSPSGLARDDIGKNIPYGIADGIEDAGGDVSEEMIEILMASFDVAQEIAQRFSVIGKEIVMSIVEGMLSAMPLLINGLQMILDSMIAFGSTFADIWLVAFNESMRLTAQFANEQLRVIRAMAAQIAEMIRLITLGSINIIVPNVTYQVAGILNSMNPLAGLVRTTIAPIPGLAQGGLIPPNNPRMVMVGDNRHEEEIVSPRSAMREEVINALEEVMGDRFGGYGGQQQKPIEVTMVLDGTIVGKVMLPILKETQRLEGVRIQVREVPV